MLAHIPGTSSKGSCTAQRRAGRERLFLTLLLMEICHGLGVQERSPPPASSIPAHQPQVVLAFPSGTSPGRQRQAALARQGRGMQGCSHPLPAHSSGGGEEQEAAELSRLLGNTPANLHPVRKHFFPAIRMGFTGAGSGLADQVVLRNHTSYLEGPRIHFGQVPATQPDTGCEMRLPMGTAQRGGLQGG